MEIYLICLASALIGGLMLSRLTKLLNLPAVTAYLVAGLLLGSFALGRMNIPGLGFRTLEQVELMDIVTQTALAMALTAATLPDGALARNVALFAVLLYELIGPALTKRSLLAVDEIKSEGRTSARRHNEPNMR